MDKKKEQKKLNFKEQSKIFEEEIKFYYDKIKASKDQQKLSEKKQERERLDDQEKDELSKSERMIIRNQLNQKHMDLKLTYDTVEQLFQEASSTNNEQDKEFALQQAEKILIMVEEKNPKVGKILSLLSEVYIYQEKFIQSIDFFQDFVTTDKSQACGKSNDNIYAISQALQKLSNNI